MLRLCCLLACVAAIWGCAGNGDGNLTNDPPVPAGSTSGTSAPVGDVFRVKLETSKGDVVIEVHPEWAPNGAARFKELVELGFYNDCRFFRVLDNFMAQVGMNGDPALHAQWGDNNIPDDPVTQSNTRGFVTFAQTGMPNSRSTQFFISFGDNSFLDQQRFAPFGQVIEGMEVVESLYSGYGEGAPQGNGPAQDQIAARGNEYLNSEFPMLDYIKTARIVGAETAAPAGEGTAAEAGTDASTPAATTTDEATSNP
jgi:peptidyl-prolyl cis-trans isomerase A (cyclophilin A)